MNAVERKFLLAVERGDINTLKALLNSDRRGLDINCCDPLARNALVIAIDNENLEIVKILIEAGIRVGDALLYAIDENFVEAVELLLDHEQVNTNSGRRPSWEQDRENSFFSADMTPIILAAHRNNFEIIKILLDRRISRLPDPHEPQCDCESCQEARARDCLKHSRSRINAYRALASPCLMALSSPDPLLAAFQMSAKLENLAKMEPEYKEDYLRLRSQCQNFATRLLDYTRTSKEMEILLNYSDEYVDGKKQRQATMEDPNRTLQPQESMYEMSLRTTTTSLDKSNNSNSSGMDGSLNDSYHSGQQFAPNYNIMFAKKVSVLSLDSVTGRHESYRSDMRLARLKLAIQCKQKTFCAHPNIQELLATMWYENLPGFRRKNPFAQTLQILMIGFMFPVYSIAYLVAPHSKLGRYIKKPFIKFICHSASYITFLIVLILASQRVEAFYSWTSVMKLFSIQDSSVVTTETNLTLLKKMPAPTTDYDDMEINALAALYKMGASQGGATTARGLESLSKIFEQLPASAKKRGTPPSPIEMVILLWVVALIWAEVKQVRVLGMNYYKADMWNILDSVASGFYIGTIILRIISYVESNEASNEVAREHWHAYDPTLLSEGLFAAATIFSALKLVYIFSVNPYLGPLQISLGRMIIDILRFSWIYMLVLFSFACGMNQLLWYYADLERHQCLNVTNYSLAQYYSAQHDKSHSPPPLDGSMIVTTRGMTSSHNPFLMEHESQFAESPSNLAHLLNVSNATLGFVTNVTSMPITTTSGFSESSPVSTTASTLTTTLASATSPILAAAATTTTTPSSTSTSTTTTTTTTTTASTVESDDEKIMEEALTASMEDDSSKPPVTIDDSCKTWRHFSNVFESSQTLFWATFGLSDLENFDLTGIRQYTRFWALLMFGCYCFINVIVVLNLLIAMMNHSYVKIWKKSDIEWKFARTRLWMSYFDTGSTVPAPFNIIPSLKSIVNLGRRLPTTKNSPHAEICERQLTMAYRNVVRTLVRRYLVKEQRTLEKKRELTEAKLNRWAKLNAFDKELFFQ